MSSVNLNLVVLAGELLVIGEPVTLADGSSMVELRLRVDGGTVPVWCSADDRVPAPGSEVVVRASARHRLFRAGGRVVGRTELVAAEIRSRRAHRSRRRLIDAALAELGRAAA